MTGGSILTLEQVPADRHRAGVRRALILAAGVGERLRPLTDELPKCLAPVGGEPILVRALRTLADCGLSEVVIVVGHRREQIMDLIGRRFAGMDITYVAAPLYDRTNNICSFWEARDYCNQDLLLLEADVLFEIDVMRRLLAHHGSSMAVAPYRSWHSGTVVRMADGGRVTAFVMGAEQGPEFDFGDCFKTANIYLLRAEPLREYIMPAVAARVDAGHVQLYYESVFRDLVAAKRIELFAVDVGDLLWCEVDDYQDLETAESLFAPETRSVERIQEPRGAR